MPKRGSVQLLLLSFRPRVTRWLGLGAVAMVLLLAGLVQLREQLPLLAQSGLSQALRQSAWEQALAGQSQAERWPWEGVSANMSLAPTANVPRLGLSAAVLKHDAGAPKWASMIESRIEPRRTAQAKAGKDPAALGDVALGDVALGDAAIGSTRQHHLHRSRRRNLRLSAHRSSRGGSAPRRQPGGALRRRGLAVPLQPA